MGFLNPWDPCIGMIATLVYLSRGGFFVRSENYVLNEPANEYFIGCRARRAVDEIMCSFVWSTDPVVIVGNTISSDHKLFRLNEVDFTVELFP